MQTGPVVTLRVAKFGASYHGLASLLNQQNSGSYKNLTKHVCRIYSFLLIIIFFVSSTQLGDESLSWPKNVVYPVSNLDSEISEYPCGLSKRKKEQMMRRNRQLYRSNPNMISKYHCLVLVSTLSENPTACSSFLLYTS